MKNTTPISIFIPVYNGETALEKNTPKIMAYLKLHFLEYEVIIVDDASTDNTPKVALTLSKNPRISYVRFDKGPTRRENLSIAFKKSKYGVVVFMDVDLATDLKYLVPLVENISKCEYSISVGSRYKGHGLKRKLSRLVISKIYNFFIRFYFRSKIHDHQCGFKAFKKKVLLNLIKEMGYDHTLKRGWFWDAELLVRAQRSNYPIKEMPVKWNFGEKSTFNIRREIKMMGYVIKLKWRL